MGMAAVVRLMIEEVKQNVREDLFLRLSGCRPVFEGTRERGVVVLRDHRDQALVLREPRTVYRRRRRDPSERAHK